MVNKKQILALVLCIAMVGAAGCAGWGQDGPADSGESEDNTTNEPPQEQDQSSDNDSADDGSNGAADGDDGTSDESPPDSTGDSDDTNSQSDDSECTSDCPDSDDSDENTDSQGDTAPDSDDGSDSSPSDGTDGDDETDGTDGSDGSDGSDGEDGSDGSDGSGGSDGSDETNETGGDDDSGGANESDGSAGDGQNETSAPETYPLNVSVVNHNDEPVENASISVVTDDGSDEVASGTTDANGTASLDVENGEYHVIVDHEDVLGDAATPVTVDGAGAEANLSLNTSDRKATGIVKVVDQNGDPVEGEPVTLWPPGAVEEESTETRETDENGEVVIELSAGDPSDVVMFDVVVRDQEQNLGIMADAYQGVQEVIFEVDTSGGDEKLNCSAFETHEEAQSYYEEDPEERGHLDADNDDVACEALQGDSPSAALTVTVEDSEGEPIEDVLVAATGPDAEIYSATTDENGEATLDSLIDGEYTVYVPDNDDENAHVSGSDEQTVTMEGEDQGITLSVERADSGGEQEYAPASAIDVTHIKHGGAEPFTEFDRVTIANTHDELPLDVGGWAIDVSDQHDAVTLPEDLVLEPGESYEVVLDGDDKVLDSSGGVLYVYDDEGNQISEVNYVGSPSHPYMDLPEDGNETGPNETAPNETNETAA